MNLEQLQKQILKNNGRITKPSFPLNFKSKLLLIVENIPVAIKQLTRNL